MVFGGGGSGLFVPMRGLLVRSNECIAFVERLIFSTVGLTNLRTVTHLTKPFSGSGTVIRTLIDLSFRTSRPLAIRLLIPSLMSGCNLTAIYANVLRACRNMLPRCARLVIVYRRGHLCLRLLHAPHRYETGQMSLPFPSLCKGSAATDLIISGTLC